MPSGRGGRGPRPFALARLSQLPPQPLCGLCRRIEIRGFGNVRGQGRRRIFFQRHPDRTLAALLEPELHQHIGKGLGGSVAASIRRGRWIVLQEHCTSSHQRRRRLTEQARIRRDHRAAARVPLHRHWEIEA